MPPGTQYACHETKMNAVASAFRNDVPQHHLPRIWHATPTTHRIGRPPRPACQTSTCVSTQLFAAAGPKPWHFPRSPDFRFRPFFQVSTSTYPTAKSNRYTQPFLCVPNRPLCTRSSAEKWNHSTRLPRLLQNHVSPPPRCPVSSTRSQCTITSQTK